MGRLLVAAFLFASCGESNPASDAGPGGDAAGSADARPPNTKHIGLVQAIHNSSTGGSSLAVGFYEEPAVAPGCTWTYAGACALALCDMGAGLVAVSAGVVTLTAGTATAMAIPNASAVYATQPPIPALPPSTAVAISAAGDVVGAFSADLVMQAPLTVTAPAASSDVMRTQPLDVTWTPAASGTTYVTLSQGQSGQPYPASFIRTTRCLFPAQAGAGTIPAELLGLLEAGVNTIIVAAAVDDRVLDVGDYQILVRGITYDQIRPLNIL